MSKSRLQQPYWCHEILDDDRFDRFVITGGLGCLRGDVKIRTINGLVPIADLSSPTHVLSWDEKSNQFCYRLASASFQKGKGYLFRVSTTLGEFVANGYHRLLLASNDYQQVDQLAVGDVVSYCHTPSLTTKAHALLKFLLSDAHLSQKALNLIYRCLSESRRYDRRPQQVQDIALDASPLLTDALRQPHICDLSFSSDKGVLLEQSHEHIQVGQSCDHSCMLDYAFQLLGIEGVEADRASTLFFERALLASPALKQSLLMFFFHHKEELIDFDHKSSCLLRSLFKSPSVCMSEAPIVALERLDSNEAYYDLSVEGTHNYITEDGTIHHNSAKTTNGLITFFLHIFRNPNAKLWWVIAPVYSRIDDSVIPAITFGLSLLGILPNVHYKLIKSKPAQVRITATGQTVMLLSADRPDTMVSATLGGYFITEAFRIKREVYENVESRTRSRFVDRTLGIMEGTPEGDTWGKDEFNIERYDTRRKLRRFILHTHDNQHNLHPSYIPRLMQVYAHNPAQIRSYVYGEFSSFRTGDVFGQWVESRNLIPQLDPDPMLPLEFCFDFNATPLTYSVWQKVWYRIDNVTRHREVCINESSLNLTSLAQAVASIVIQFPIHIFKDTEILIWGDRTGHAKSHKATGTDFTNIQALLHEAGYKHVNIKAPRQITPIRASVDTLNKLFLYELALVCDNCKNVRRSFNNTKWKAGTDDLEKPSGETHTHHSDGVRYRIYELYKGADINTLVNRTVIGFNPV